MSFARYHGFLIPAAARQLVAESDHIGVMPQLVVQLMRYLKDEKAKVSDLAKDISSDAGMTAELIKLINSSAFGLRSKITHIESAVKYLGIRRTVSLVFELSFHSIRESWHDRLPPELMIWFGTRSVVNACVASAFAVRRKDVPSDTVYVLALLQDLGILVLCHKYHDQYPHLLKQARSVPLLQLERLEKAEYAFTHADVSAALLQHWEFPATMIQLVLEHHNSTENLSEMDRKLLHVMKLGESVANLRDVPSPQRHMRFQELLSDSGVTSSSNAKACIASAIAHSREVTSYFELGIPEKDSWWSLAKRIQDFVNENPSHNPANPFLVGESAAAAAESAPRSRVLVIDDEPAIGKMLKFFLNDLPLVVECLEAPPDLSHVGPDVAIILCDVHLNQRNGIDFVRELRARGFAKPVMMMSGDRSRNTVMQSIDAGIIEYIAKPFTKETIVAKFQKHGLLHIQAPSVALPIGMQ